MRQITKTDTRPSNTERGHKDDLSEGRIVAQLRGFTLREGQDVHDVASGGSKVTKRNRITIEHPNGSKTIWRNTEADQDKALSWWAKWTGETPTEAAEASSREFAIQVKVRGY